MPRLPPSSYVVDYCDHRSKCLLFCDVLTTKIVVINLRAGLLKARAFLGGRVEGGGGGSCVKHRSFDGYG